MEPVAERSHLKRKVGSPTRLRPSIRRGDYERSPVGSSLRASIWGWTLAPGTAACQYWSCAGAAAELRMLRPGSRPGIPGRVHLQLRVHLVPRLRGERPARRLSELRRRTCPAPHPPGPSARSQPAVDRAGCPTRLRSGALSWGRRGCRPGREMREPPQGAVAT